MMQSLLFYLAIFFAAAKLVSTVALLRHSDATTATSSRSGKFVYFVGKVTPALVVASFLARALIGGDIDAASNYAMPFGAVVVAAVLVVRLRQAGKWHGLVHTPHSAFQRRGGA